jgi:LacI family transcriptional regulator
MKWRKQIFFLLSWNDYRIFLGISRYAREAGWRMETRHFFTNQLPPDRTFHGMIAMGHRDPAVNAFVREKAQTIPTVVLGTDSPGIDAPAVVPDNPQLARMAAQHLYDLYHKQYGWFACDASPSGDERQAAFRGRLAEWGMALTDLSGPHPAAHPSALIARLKACPKPLGVLCRDDHDAVVLLEHCREARLRVPEEVAVVGIGDLESLCAISPVPLTSVSPDMEQLGYQAAAVLDRRMHGSPVPPVTVVPPGPLIRRASTGCLAIVHPRLKQAVQVIDTRFHEPLSMETIAAAAGVSRRQLYLLFQQELRGPPHRYILDVRLENALRMIVENTLPQQQIARACGFGTTRTLCRVFHQRFGLPPAKWGSRARGGEPGPPPSKRHRPAEGR